MKRIIISCFALVTLLTFFSCKELGRIDQIDDTIPAPKPVEITQVTSIPGGAVIKVEIPDDDNLKGVVATYERNGEIVNTKISRYLDSLLIVGYADLEEHEVKVSSFNVNEVTSDPVITTITPLPSAVKTVEFDMVESFGGIKIHLTNNTSNADLAVCLLADKNLRDRKSVV